jgi:thiosulfate/3-mercaptopyruvate sulfurtransferase
MKHDITSPNCILSRKIKAGFLTVSILAFTVIGVSQSALSAPDFELLITPNQVQSLAENERVVIDTRPSWKYMLEHIPGALNISSWKEFTLKSNGVPGQINQDKEFIVQKLRALGIDPRKTIVIYGDLSDKWRTDGRFFWMFEFYGFKRVALLKGGFQNWKKAGFPKERGFGQSPKPSVLKTSDIHFNRDILADQNWIASRLGSQGVALIDNREKHEFDGATPYGSSRGGHIPGALHIDWREFFTSEGTLKPRETLDALLKSKGIQSNQEIVVYCTGGVRSAMAYFVFRHLGYNVRNYDGSWWDWSHNPKLPIES